MRAVDRYEQIAEYIGGVGGFSRAVSMREIAKHLGLKRTPYLEDLVEMVVSDNPSIHKDWRLNKRGQSTRYYWGIDQTKYTAEQEMAILDCYEIWYAQNNDRIFEPFNLDLRELCDWTSDGYLITYEGE